MKNEDKQWMIPTAEDIVWTLSDWRPGNAHFGTYEYHMEQRRGHIKDAREKQRQGKKFWAHIACARTHNYVAALRKQEGIFSQARW